MQECLCKTLSHVEVAFSNCDIDKKMCDKNLSNWEFDRSNSVNYDPQLKCTLCHVNKKNDEDESNKEVMIAQAADWFKLRQAMEQHKSCFPALSTQLGKRARCDRWEKIQDSATEARLALMDVITNEAAWLTRPHIRKLIKNIRAAADTWMHQPHEVWANKPMIYARFNLSNDEVYIGQTTNWDDRFRAHTREVMKHFKNHCKGCGMHHAYTKQARLHPGEWVMIPINFPPTLDLGRREKQMIYGQQSKLNKEIYCRLEGKVDNCKRRRRAYKRSGKQRQRVATIKFGEANTDEDAIDTWGAVYKCEQHGEFESNSLVTLFETLEKHWYREGWIAWNKKFKNGDTNWKLLDFKHGQCEVLINGEGESSTLQVALTKLKLMKEGRLKIIKWDIRESTKATEKMLEQLGAKRCNMKEFMKLGDSRLKSLWEHMTDLQDKKKRMKVRGRLYIICDRKYGFVPFKQLRFHAPFSPLLRKGEYRRFIVNTLAPVMEELPATIRTYILQNIRVTRKKRKNIGDMLVNFRFFAREQETKCGCKQVQAAMNKHGYKTPMVEGHVAFIGSKYEGPFKEVLQQNCKNTPMPTFKEDVLMAKGLWATDIKRLPPKWRKKLLDNKEVEGKIRLEESDLTLLRNSFRQEALPTTVKHNRVKQLKQLLGGMCISTLDKNSGQLHVCCPKVYDTIMQNTFDEKKVKHYEEVRPVKFSEKFAKSNFKNFTNIYGEEDPGKLGNENDIIKYWEWMYYKNKWNKIVPFNGKGGIGDSYALCKFKHWEPTELNPKWKTGRPISPMWRHPMAALLKAVGRAWMFIIKQWQSHHFILHAAQKVNEEVQLAMQSMKTASAEGQGLALLHKVWDIDSMYPSMPKQDMTTALSTILDEVVAQARLRVTHVTVPNSKSLPIRWGKQYGEYDKNNSITVPLKEMMGVTRFSLEHCVTKVRGQRILRQCMGIPMGDSLSPALAVGTCAWFERKWVETIPEEHRWRVKGIRYMDDVLMIINDEGWGGAEKVFEEFTTAGGCYPEPLSLSEDSGETYLECVLHNKGGEFLLQHWNKNGGSETKQRFYNGTHAHSYSEEKHKAGAIIGTMVRMVRNSSNEELLQFSLKEKRRELKFLKYSEQFIGKMVKVMEGKFPEYEWE